MLCTVQASSSATFPRIGSCFRACMLDLLNLAKKKQCYSSSRSSMHPQLSPSPMRPKRNTRPGENSVFNGCGGLLTEAQERLGELTDGRFVFVAHAPLSHTPLPGYSSSWLNSRIWKERSTLSAGGGTGVTILTQPPRRY